MRGTGSAGDEGSEAGELEGRAVEISEVKFKDKCPPRVGAGAPAGRRASAWLT